MAAWEQASDDDLAAFDASLDEIRYERCFSIVHRLQSGGWYWYTIFKFDGQTGDPWRGEGTAPTEAAAFDAIWEYREKVRSL